MSIDAALVVAAADSVDRTSYSTASVAPTANEQLLLAVLNNISSGTPNTPTVTGCGLTWTEVTSVRQGIIRLTLFRASGPAPSAGALTIDFAGQTQGNCHWVLSEHADVDLTDPIVQSATAKETGVADTTFTATLAAFADADNATYACFGSASTGALGGFGAEIGSALVGSRALQSRFLDDEDLTPQFTYASNSLEHLTIGVELRQSGGTNATVTPAAVATVSTVPAPAIVTHQPVAVTAVATAAAVPTPDIALVGGSSAATVLVATIATTTTIEEYGFEQSALTDPAAVGTAVTIPTPTVTGTAEDELPELTLIVGRLETTWSTRLVSASGTVLPHRLGAVATLTLPAATDEYVRVVVAGRADNRYIDMTDTEVQFQAAAVGTASVDLDEAEWADGSWDRVGEARYQAKVLTQSDLGLSDTGSWDVWLRIPTSPETPVRKVGRLILT